jgi:hypothetical protein
MRLCWIVFILCLSYPAFSAAQLRSLHFRLDDSMGLDYGFPQKIQIETLEIINDLFREKIRIRGTMGEERFDVTRTLNLESGTEEYLFVSALLKKEMYKDGVCGDFEEKVLTLLFRTDRTGTGMSHFRIAARYAYSADACDTKPEGISFSYAQASK